MCTLVYVRADVHLCVLWRGRGITRATHTEWPPRAHCTPRHATQLGQSAARHASLPLLAIAIRTIIIRTCDGGWVLAEIASGAVVSSVERTSSSGPSMSLADERCHHANGAWMSLTLSLRPPAMGAMRNTLRATGGRSHWMSSSKVGTRLEVSGISRRHTVRIVRKVFAASTPRPRRRASGSRMPVLCIHAISLSKSTSAFSRTLIGLTDSLCTFGTFQSVQRTQVVFTSLRKCVVNA